MGGRATPVDLSRNPRGALGSEISLPGSHPGSLCSSRPGRKAAGPWRKPRPAAYCSHGRGGAGGWFLSWRFCLHRLPAASAASPASSMRRCVRLPILRARESSMGMRTTMKPTRIISRVSGFILVLRKRCRRAYYLADLIAGRSYGKERAGGVTSSPAQGHGKGMRQCHGGRHLSPFWASAASALCKGSLPVSPLRCWFCAGQSPPGLRRLFFKKCVFRP